MSQDKRLASIEGQLTPSQAMVLWLQQVHGQYRDLHQYVRHLRHQPESQAPLYLLPQQVEQATRQSMRGQPKPVVEAAARRAVRDAAFLVYLHNQCNFRVMLEHRAWERQLVALAERLLRILAEDSSRSMLRLTTSLRLERETPYPLETDTAGAVQAAVQNHVTTWAELEDTLEEWLDSHLLAHGAMKLPEGSYEWREDGFRPVVTQQNEAEVRACFDDDIEFERFRSGEDYSNALAGVRDAEYRAHYERMVMEMHGLVESGKVKAGCSAWLETVPVSFLREAPLLEGKWIDRQVVQLAEWGALLREAGYQAKEAEDHPLAADRFYQGESEVSRPRMAALQRKAEKRLQGFRGRTRRIEGRPYLHFADYSKWPGRGVPGDPREDVQTGFCTSSWNRWIGARGGEGIATVGGNPVERLHCYVSEYACCVSGNSAAEREHRRQKIASELLALATPSRRQIEMAQDFQEAVESFLLELCGSGEAFDWISQRYFAGQEVLFSDLAQCLAELIEDTENLAERFNEMCKEGSGLEPVDRDRAQRGAAAVAADLRSYVVDMAKANALEFMGEKQAGLELVERHLE